MLSLLRIMCVEHLKGLPWREFSGNPQEILKKSSVTDPEAEREKGVPKMADGELIAA